MVRVLFDKIINIIQLEKNLKENKNFKWIQWN